MLNCSLVLFSARRERWLEEVVLREEEVVVQKDLRSGGGEGGR